MRKIIIHIGTHKTGSTAIQHMLYANNRALRKNKFKLVNNNGGNFIDTVCDLEKSNTNDNYIISYEGLSGDMHAGYGSVSDRLKVFSRLQDIYDIELIVFYREQVEFLESAYCQHIHEGGYRSFEEYFNSYNIDSLDYTNHLKMVQETLPKAKVKATFYVTRDLISDFIEMTGLYFLKGHNKVKNKNVSYNVNAINFARHVNPILSESEKKKLRIILQQVENKHNGPEFHMPKDKVLMIREKFKKSNSELSKALSINNFSYDNKRETLNYPLLTNLQVATKVALYKNDNSKANVISRIKKHFINSFL